MRLCIIDDLLIGGGIGPIRLSADRKRVVKLLGKPQNSINSPDARGVTDHYGDVQLSYRQTGNRFDLIEIRIQKNTRSFSGGLMNFRGRGLLRVVGQQVRFGTTASELELVAQHRRIKWEWVLPKQVGNLDFEYRYFSAGGLGLISVERKSIFNPSDVFRTSAVIVK